MIGPMIGPSRFKIADRNSKKFLWFIGVADFKSELKIHKFEVAKPNAKCDRICIELYTRQR